MYLNENQSVIRSHWLTVIEQSWKKRNIVWLAGVRRAGKTTLVRMVQDAQYLNCDLPSVVRKLGDAEAFFRSLPSNATVIFDEIHRLNDPARVLKIAADEFKHLRIIATGSSTLAATKKFRDSLTGRKKQIFLPPILWKECKEDFGIMDLDKRLLHGGLPEMLLAGKKVPEFYAEWIDSFYARDIQELFSIRNRSGFLKLLNILLHQSGGLIDYSSLSRLCEMSRPTVISHIDAMCVASAMFLLPPFHGMKKREIVKRPKCYSFDTGFVTYAKGWNTIRSDDRGILWEHVVLETLRAIAPQDRLYFWRDKSGKEIDFIVRHYCGEIDAIECKINPDTIASDNIQKFHELYPSAKFFIVSPVIADTYQRDLNGLPVTYSSLESLQQHITKRTLT